MNQVAELERRIDAHLADSANWRQMFGERMTKVETKIALAGTIPSVLTIVVLLVQLHVI